MRIYQGNWQANLQFLESHHFLRPNQSILEIGSGSGYLIDYFAKKNITIQGIELDPKYIVFAQNKFGIELKKMSGDSLKFPDHTFDTIISFDVFEHIPDTDKHLSEVKRVLKNQGTYLFSTPNKITNIPWQILTDRSFTKYQREHCSLHTYWDLQRCLTANGFQYKFHKLNLQTEFYRNKIRNHLGKTVERMVTQLPLNKLPIPFMSNFFISSISTK